MIVKTLMKELGPKLRVSAPHELVEFNTPQPKVFVVSHLGLPAMDVPSWRLSIGGLVDRPLELTLADIESMPRTELVAAHECAGHPLKPRIPVRRVANVRWAGVRLNLVLRAAGIGPRARFVWARGADRGIYAPTATHCQAYVKDLPLTKAIADEVLLAFELNGQPLREAHGAPLRLVVPGYYATNSVKWLTEIRLEQARSESYFTTTLYNDRVDVNGVESLVPVWSTSPNTIVVEPNDGALLRRGPQRIWGWAWGAREVRRIEISPDGGRSWADAEVEARQDFSWQRFELQWSPPHTGEFQLLCRATDSSGVGQPEIGARNEWFKCRVRID